MQGFSPIFKNLLSIVVLLLEIPVQFLIGLLGFSLRTSAALPQSNQLPTLLLALLALFAQTYLAYLLFKSARDDRDHNSMVQWAFIVLNFIIGIVIFFFYIILFFASPPLSLFNINI